MMKNTKVVIEELSHLTAFNKKYNGFLPQLDYLPEIEPNNFFDVSCRKQY